MNEKKTRVQSEIENFLAEVTGGRAKKPAPNPERQARRRRQAEARRRQQEKQRQAEEQKRQQAARAKARQKKKKRKIGSGIREHVDQYINQHVAAHIDHDVDEYVEATIVDSVEENLGDRDTEMPTTTGHRKGPSAASEVAKLLRDPKGVRNAILVNEILSRPRSLRRDK